MNGRTSRARKRKKERIFMTSPNTPTQPEHEPVGTNVSAQDSLKALEEYSRLVTPHPEMEKWWEAYLARGVRNHIDEGCFNGLFAYLKSFIRRVESEAEKRGAVKALSGIHFMYSDDARRDDLADLLDDIEESIAFKIKHPEMAIISITPTKSNPEE